MLVIRKAAESELRTALGALLGRPETTSAELHRQIDALLRHASRSRLSLEHCLVAEEGGRLAAACLCVDAPGRTASVFLPNHLPDLPCTEAVIRMLEEHERAARDRNIQLLQGMCAADGRVEQELFTRSGYQRLTELIYLERDVARSAPAEASAAPVKWEEYGAWHPADFAKLVQWTYEGSLDCAGLSGVRSIEDTLASHRATGEFDPRCWLAARVEGQAVGVLLLSRLTDRSSVEIVYMGLIPAVRGRGLGHAVLRRALEAGRQRGVAWLTLTVDVENAPARRLYERFGFYETARREVWMRILGTSD